MKVKLIASAAEARAALGDVTALFQSAFGRELDMRSWSDYYFENPYGDPIVALGYSDDMLVGHYALVPQKLVDRAGQGYPYYLGISLMLHPQYRKGFLAFYELMNTALGAARARELPFLLTFPNANSFQLIEHGFKWQMMVETGLYNWRPDRPDQEWAQVVPLGSFGLSGRPDELDHPCDATYREWRSHAIPYMAELVNGRLEIIYKLLDGHLLMVLDAHTAQPELGAHDLGALLAYTGARQARMSGVHASAIGLDPATMERHTDYSVRMYSLPIASEVPKLRFGLLLSDIF
ncbi:GNAT family N-acetyltransferase [Oscillochloris sp. ZM17-4]|uniref:GNAT family N-acetyltransferase n=1 Tax=Oscillochloris sp. ZM17-4 TaxID=2866714 RepID=UPI001C73B0BE|nr:GNAT family N-acetyltransferase [Oscillochloris sp. ZM17-4]MBX0331336.1 GNAT family N-acetyltransferase [Oscillochloris sp. ZM17-4]